MENLTSTARGIGMKTALITGITGQDGKHLTKLLIEKRYKVTGLVSGQRSDIADSFLNEFPEVELIRGDLADLSSLIEVIDKTAPHEIYNLGAISFVGLSFQQPELTSNVTGLGALRLLEAMRKLGIEKSTRFYQASSSEMFGRVRETPQNELTPFYPRSPYGVAKTFAHYMTVNYREAYGMHASCGILFNHEGENRGYEFVTRKITSNVAKIATGKIKKFSLGPLHPQRDWGYAGDYVEAMWMMLQQETPDDYVIATGKTHSVEEFLIKALRYVGLEGEIGEYVDYDKKFERPSEVDLLVGDPTKAAQKLGWTPKVSFENLVEIMMENDLAIENK